MIRSLIPLLSVLSLTLVGLSAQAAGITGSLTIGTGYLENPLGVSNDTAAGYLSQSLRLSSTFGSVPESGQVFKLVY